MMKKCKTKSGLEGICQKEKDGYICNREKSHKGKHHAHSGEDCFFKW